MGELLQLEDLQYGSFDLELSTFTLKTQHDISSDAETSVPNFTKKWTFWKITTVTNKQMNEPTNKPTDMIDHNTSWQR